MLTVSAGKAMSHFLAGNVPFAATCRSVKCPFWYLMVCNSPGRYWDLNFSRTYVADDVAGTAPTAIPAHSRCSRAFHPLVIDVDETIGHDVLHGAAAYGSDRLSLYPIQLWVTPNASSNPVPAIARPSEALVTPRTICQAQAKHIDQPLSRGAA